MIHLIISGDALLQYRGHVTGFPTVFIRWTCFSQMSLWYRSLMASRTRLDLPILINVVCERLLGHQTRHQDMIMRNLDHFIHWIYIYIHILYTGKICSIGRRKLYWNTSIICPTTLHPILHALNICRNIKKISKKASIWPM